MGAHEYLLFVDRPVRLAAMRAGDRERGPVVPRSRPNRHDIALSLQSLTVSGLCGERATWAVNGYSPMVVTVTVAAQVLRA